MIEYQNKLLKVKEEILMEFLRSIYFSFDENAKVEIFKGLIFYSIAILVFCILVYVGGKILSSSSEGKGKVSAFVFGVILANIVAVTYILYLLREIGIVLILLILYK